MSYHSVFLAAGLATIAGTLIALRRAHIRAEYSVSWLAVGVLMSGLALFPGLIDQLSNKLGMQPQSSLLMVGGVLISILVFEISRVVSQLRDENVLLAQRVAILEYRIQHYRIEQRARDD
jgi:hypothetical protein